MWSSADVEDEAGGLTLAAVAAASGMAVAPAAGTTPYFPLRQRPSASTAASSLWRVRRDAREGFAAGAAVSLEVADADGDVYLTHSGTADSSGTVSFDVAPTRAGESTITLTGEGADGEQLVLSTTISVQKAGAAAVRRWTRSASPRPARA